MRKRKQRFGTSVGVKELKLGSDVLATASETAVDSAVLYLHSWADATVTDMIKAETVVICGMQSCVSCSDTASLARTVSLGFTVQVITTYNDEVSN